MTMLPKRPYLLRAWYQWVVDHEWTPLLVVDASLPGVQVPSFAARESSGRMVLNISPKAVRDWSVENVSVSFFARFSGNVEEVIVPMRAVLGIYARENGEGCMFEEERVAFEWLEKTNPASESQVSEDIQAYREEKKMPSYLRIVQNQREDEDTDTES